MALVECKECGKKTSEGFFCEKCGAELSAGASSVGEAGGVKPDQSAQPANAGAAQSGSLDKSDTAMELLEETGSFGPRIPPPKPQPLFRAGSAPPSCSYMHVEHDQSRVFVVGQTMNFRFALTPLVDDLSDVFVAVVFEGRGRKVEVKRLGWIPCLGERRELRNINFAAPEAGSLGFSFYFGFKVDGKGLVFEADGEHKVWPSQARASDVVRNLEINIQNTGHASDFNLSGIKDQLRPDERLEEVIDRFHRMPPLWAGLSLYGSTWRLPRVYQQKTSQLVPVPLDGAPSAAARVVRLTLRADGRSIHLMTGDTIRLGKNRQNDVITRLYEKGTATSALNSKISRYHCLIERQGKKCFVVDRGDYPREGSRPSAYGIFLDGQRTPALGRRELASNGKHTLTLAGSDSDIPGVFGLSLECWSCADGMRRICRRNCDAGKTGSLVLRRCDPVPETYVALWECFALGEADPDFDGIVVWREGNGFGYVTADAEGWLQPGMTIQTLQCEVRVEAWKQYGL